MCIPFKFSGNDFSIAISFSSAGAQGFQVRMIDAHLKLACESLQRLEFIVYFRNLALEQLFIPPAFFSQLTNLGNPACHNGRALAAAVDEVAGALLIGLDLLLIAR